MKMNKTKITPLFFYGTLRSKEVRDAVLNKNTNKLILSDAYLIGFKLFKVMILGMSCAAKVKFLKFL